MPVDARISITLPSHPKTQKLIRRQGPAAAWNLICLFLWCAGNRSDGDLSGMDAEDIEIAAGWTGEPGVLLRALIDVGFVDGEAGSYTVHDWQEHNPWAAGAKDRSTASAWAALCKRYGRAGAAERMPDYAARMRPAQEGHADGSDPQCDPDAPLPSPSPIPSPIQEPPKSPKGDEHPEKFLALRKAYPSRGTSADPNKTAFAAWSKAIDAGANPDEMIRMAPNAAPPEKHGTGFVPQLAKWIEQERWKDAPTVKAVVENADPHALWRSRLTTWANSPKPVADRFWPAMWGPKPPAVNTDIPAVLVAEFNLDGLALLGFLARTA